MYEYYIVFNELDKLMNFVTDDLSIIKTECIYLFFQWLNGKPCGKNIFLWNNYMSNDIKILNIEFVNTCIQCNKTYFIFEMFSNLLYTNFKCVTTFLYVSTYECMITFELYGICCNHGICHNKINQLPSHH